MLYRKQKYLRFVSNGGICLLDANLLSVRRRPPYRNFWGCLTTLLTDYRIESIVLGPVGVKEQHDRRFTFPPFTPGLRIRARKIK